MEFIQLRKYRKRGMIFKNDIYNTVHPVILHGEDGSNAKHVPTSGMEVVSKLNLTLLFTCIF